MADTTSILDLFQHLDVNHRLYIQARKKVVSMLLQEYRLTLRYSKPFDWIIIADKVKHKLYNVLPPMILDDVISSGYTWGLRVCYAFVVYVYGDNTASLFEDELATNFRVNDEGWLVDHRYPSLCVRQHGLVSYSIGFDLYNTLERGNIFEIHTLLSLFPKEYLILGEFRLRFSVPDRYSNLIDSCKCEECITLDISNTFGNIGAIDLYQKQVFMIRMQLINKTTRLPIDSEAIMIKYLTTHWDDRDMLGSYFYHVCGGV
jgi:hypothetical protein